MVQGFVGGATSYEEQSLQDILEDIIRWIYYTEDRKTYITQKHRKLLESKFWDRIPYDFQATIVSTIAYFDTIIHDLEIVKTAIESSNVTQREVRLLKNIGYKAQEYNREYPHTFRKDRFWHAYGDSDFEVAENIYARGRDYFVTMQDAANAASRLEDYMDNRNIINNNLNINGPVSGSQIQQGNINSTQTVSSGANFDYEAVLKVLRQVERYFEDTGFKEDFGEKTDVVKSIVTEAIEDINKREEPSKIKVAVNELKNLANGIAGSLIATGICGLLGQLPL